MKTIDRLESEVRSYCRNFPTVFASASGETLVAENGREFIDFFAGAGVMNYGHNPPNIQNRLIAYISTNGITHALDIATTAKRELLKTFERVILKPRGLDYRLMFPGPTGTNAVEAALKLARKVTGRQNVIAFTNGFHGMTLGSLALTGNAEKRAGAGLSLTGVSHMPYCDYLGTEVDTLAAMEQFLNDSSSGMDHPAAFVVETVQAEGGVNVASGEWLKGLAKIAKKFQVLLIVDDIQVGCGRTGPFFSFEPFDFQPDIVCLSKSLSGYGLPLAMVLVKPELDEWQPGEHNGTFRGFNHAFVTTTAALNEFWSDEMLTREVMRKAKFMRDTLLDFADEYEAEVRGRGLIQGIRFEFPSHASRISRRAFELGLMIETCGPEGEVVKCLPPLTISDEGLKRGLEILGQSIADVVRKKSKANSNSPVMTRQH